MTLNDFFKENNKAVLGLSGGADSAYLLYAGLKAGAYVLPVYVKTAFQPQFELRDAERLTAELGVRLNVIELDILSDTTVAANPADRCYYCKRRIFGALKAFAENKKIQTLIDGTNASDDLFERPGVRALKELSVRSPLFECGITKDEVRRLSKNAGLFTWDKPAYACLATRIPENEPITADLLCRIEGAESALFSLGYRDLRVRVFGGAARLQLKENDLVRAATDRKQIVNSLAPYFDTVLLDLKGR
ncbi:MAG: ATP-dependent sacrificial sulfur transferase LarE [Ruminococcaceae bacterium]|nr:ATP-dependent sacrificial sulfur transferase LarE [Oscillospiraceae bacterium]